MMAPAQTDSRSKDAQASKSCTYCRRASIKNIHRVPTRKVSQELTIFNLWLADSWQVEIHLTEGADELRTKFQPSELPDFEKEK